MKSYFEIGTLRNAAARTLTAMFALCVVSVGVSAQAPPNPAPPPENIAAGALIIPMDNYHQGNADQTTFNLRAYGLANLFLQNNIPVKWAIKPGKEKDEVDFSANVTRISGVAGDAGPVNANFSGGPFIIPVEYDTPTLRGLINSFNTSGEDVVVYRTNAATTADVRYTLTHKPKIAIGPDGGNYGGMVHQGIFNAAGITQYEGVNDSIINTESCYTLATQAHSTSSEFVDLYRQFVQSGGNLLLQCASINTFENHTNGHFQTNGAGYSIFTSNNPPGNHVSTALVYPEGAMPFNQFIGILADQTGAVTEYAYAPGGGPVNGNRVSVRNSGEHADKFVATVSELGAPGTPGSAVFELAGHNYARPDDGETDSEIARLNGQRMLLNAVFVPVTRPMSCGLQQATVQGYKSVRRYNVRQGGPGLVAGDTLEWTIDYVNNSTVEVSNFNIRDEVSVVDGLNKGNQTLVQGSNQVTVLGGGSTAVRNENYDGLGDDPTSDLLAPGAILPVGGRIQVKIRTTINLTDANGQPLAIGTILYNQGIASGAQITGTVKTDAIDHTNTIVFGIDAPPSDSFLQFQNVGILDPTIARIQGTTRADISIDGEVRMADGSPIANALVTVQNASSGYVKSVRTDALGRYEVGGLKANDLYIVTVQHKRYRFPEGQVTLMLTDSVSGLAFIGQLPLKTGAQRTLKTTSAKAVR